MKTTTCTVTVAHPIVCGSPHTRLTVKRSDHPHAAVIDWVNMTAFRHHHPNLARRIGCGGKFELCCDELAAAAKLATFDPWTLPAREGNPNPHFIDMLPWPRFAIETVRKGARR